MHSKSQLTNFENIEDKFANVVSSEEYQQLVNLFQKHDEIYVVANGGLHYVASHMATDISRLVAVIALPDNVIESPVIPLGGVANSSTILPPKLPSGFVFEPVPYSEPNG